MTNDYLERVKAYRTYLESERDNLKASSKEESLQGSISADEKVSLLETLIGKLNNDFPELR